MRYDQSRLWHAVRSARENTGSGPCSSRVGDRKGRHVVDRVKSSRKQMRCGAPVKSTERVNRKRCQLTINGKSTTGKSFRHKLGMWDTKVDMKEKWA